jgi:hypothetical protein
MRLTRALSVPSRSAADVNEPSVTTATNVRISMRSIDVFIDNSLYFFAVFIKSTHLSKVQRQPALENIGGRLLPT